MVSDVKAAAAQLRGRAHSPTETTVERPPSPRSAASVAPRLSSIARQDSRQDVEVLAAGLDADGHSALETLQLLGSGARDDGDRQLLLAFRHHPAVDEREAPLA